MLLSETIILEKMAVGSCQRNDVYSNETTLQAKYIYIYIYF